MFRDFVGRLEYQLGQELPGEETQFSMAPLARRRISEITPADYHPKKSAVLILLFPEADAVHTLLIQRPEYDGVHSGQIAFPGGKYEEEDLDLRHTALREAAEEVGVIPQTVTIIGSLTELYIPPSNFLVKPFVGFVNEKPHFTPDPYEVQHVISVDLLSLSDARNIGQKEIIHSGGYKVKTPYYDIEGFTVWGATAMIISELNAVVKNITSF